MESVHIVPVGLFEMAEYLYLMMIGIRECETATVHVADY